VSQSPIEGLEDTPSEERLRGSRALSQMMREGRSFSSHERNCVYLNTGATPAGGGRFANISAISGLDFPDDGRAVALVDWDQDGDQDLWISNRNAPRLRLMRNDTPGRNHYVAVRLEGNGTTCNRDAIGARVEVLAGGVPAESGTPGGGPKSIRTLRAGEGFLAQSGKWVHFGMGRDEVIGKVVVHWPDGTREDFAGVGIDRRFLLAQGTGRAREVASREPSVDLAPSVQEAADWSQVARISMVELLTLPEIGYLGFDGEARSLAEGAEGWTLVNMWASWCAPCLAELNEFSKRHEEIEAAGIRILALSVDGLGDDATAPAAAAELVTKRTFPFSVGRATPELVEMFQDLHNRQMPMHRRLPLPSSFLIDRQGRLAVIYKGPVSVEELLADAAAPEGSRLERFVRAAAIAGHPIEHPRVGVTGLDRAVDLRFGLAHDLQGAGRVGEAAAHYDALLGIRPDHVASLINRGATLQRLGRMEEAVGLYERAVGLEPGNLEAHDNLGLAQLRLERFPEAAGHFQEVLRIQPEHAGAHHHLGLALESMGRLEDAVQHYGEALRIDPRFAEVHNSWGIALAKQNRLEEAAGHFEQALHLEPGHEGARVNLEKARAMLKEGGGAVRP